MTNIMSMQEFFYGERELPAYYGQQITSWLPYSHDAHQTQPIPVESRRNYLTTFDLMVPMRGTKCENEVAMGSVNDVACDDRYNRRATVTGYNMDPTSSLSGYESSSYHKSWLVQQGNRDRARSYAEGDSRELQRSTYADRCNDGIYTRTFCPGYTSEASITHYVSVHPTTAMRVESMEC